MYISAKFKRCENGFTAVSSTITQYYSELQAYGRSNRFSDKYTEAVKRIDTVDYFCDVMANGTLRKKEIWYIRKRWGILSECLSNDDIKEICQNAFKYEIWRRYGQQFVNEIYKSHDKEIRESVLIQFLQRQGN